MGLLGQRLQKIGGLAAELSQTPALLDLFIPVLPDFLSFHGLKLLFETLDEIGDVLAALVGDVVGEAH